MFELLVLYGQYNQQDPESRTEFLHEVAKKLAQIEEPLERQTYLTSAANRFMIRKNDLENRPYLRSAERQRPLSHGTRDGQKAFLHRTDNRGQNH